MQQYSWDKIKIMKPGDVSCLVIKNKRSFLSYEKGVLPLMRWLQQDENFFKDAIVIDKVIGKAAALLLVYGGGAKEVYAFLISEVAYTYLNKLGIAVYYLKKVPHIINRDQTGFCPMEQRTLEIEDAEVAYRNLQQIIKL